MAFDEVLTEGREAVEDILARGFHLFGAPVDATASARLLADIRATRRFDQSLFLSEAEFEADPQYKGVNPRPGRNLLERFEADLDFVEQAPQIRRGLSAILGADYRIMDRKLVCGVPDKSMPDWIKRRIAGNPVNNLGCFVKPEYRDVTYFYGIDFHQDLIDYKDRDADFVTLYVYLHRVTRADAPLYVLSHSHLLGGAVFPHDLTAQAEGRWTYRNGAHGEVEAEQVVLTGDAGMAAVWHACTLHGTQPDAGDDERISLRYIFAPGDSRPAGMERINAALKGPLNLDATRVDLGADGAAVMKQNAVNGAS